MRRRPPQLFDHYFNVCPQQGSRTIRTEVMASPPLPPRRSREQEAILITMALLHPAILRQQQ
jgi:hypothetical protein